MDLQKFWNLYRNPIHSLLGLSALIFFFFEEEEEEEDDD
jgi:hypothetical protein